MLYLQNRRYLPSDSTLRKEWKGYIKEKPELKLPPAKRNFKKVKKSHEAVDEARKKYVQPYNYHK